MRTRWPHLPGIVLVVLGIGYMLLVPTVGPAPDTCHCPAGRTCSCPAQTGTVVHLTGPLVAIAGAIALVVGALLRPR